MWREIKILLIDDDSQRRRDLAVILIFLAKKTSPVQARTGSRWSALWHLREKSFVCWSAA